MGRPGSFLLPVFLFFLQASLLAALHTLVDGLRGSWGQPLLWGMGVHEIGEGENLAIIVTLGCHEHKAGERVLRGRLEGRVRDGSTGGV